MAEKRHRFCALMLHFLDRYNKSEVSKKYVLLWVNNQYKHTCLLYLSNTKISKKKKTQIKVPRRLKISFENGKNLREVTYTIKQIDSIMVLLFHFRFEGKPDSEGNTCIAKVSRNVKERFKTRKTDWKKL